MDWIPRDLPPDDDRCEECGQVGHGSWGCPNLEPPPLGGRGNFHNCLNPRDPYCQGECGG